MCCNKVNLGNKCFLLLLILNVSGNEHPNYEVFPLFLQFQCFIKCVFVVLALSQKLSLFHSILSARYNDSLIGTEGALRLPTTYESNPSHPSIPSTYVKVAVNLKQLAILDEIGQ